MQVPPRINKGPQLVVTSVNTFWDAKEAREADSARRELSLAKEQHGDRVEVGISTFTETFGAKLKRVGKRLVKPTLAAAIGTGLLAAAAVSGGLLAIPTAAAIAGAVTGGIPLLGMTRVANQFAESKASVAAPTGTFIENTSDKPLDLAGEDKLKNPSEIAREVIVSQMKRYPNATHVAHFNGHGHGNKTMAGLPAETARKDLIESVKRGGQKFDVAFYESCYAANFEFLHGQADVTDYAVAPQDEIPKSNAKTGRVPLGEMMSVNLTAASAKTAAEMMAQKASQIFETGKKVEITNIPQRERNLRRHRDAKWRNMDTTISAFDLGELKTGLSPQLNKLGTTLSQELKKDKSLRSAVRQARADNIIDPRGDLVDLGGFLTDLRDKGSTDLNKALDSTLKSLDKAILTSRTSEGQPLSGLSFHSRPKTSGLATGGENAHANPNLPQGWVEFIEDAF